jgi:hypothetical protein
VPRFSVVSAYFISRLQTEQLQVESLQGLGAEVRGEGEVRGGAERETDRERERARETERESERENERE